jgi:hypothetical protein
MSPYNDHADHENELMNTHDTEAVTRFVDHFFNDHGLSSPASRMRIEKLLQYLPENIHTHKEVTSWIRKNWDKKFRGL